MDIIVRNNVAASDDGLVCLLLQIYIEDLHREQ